LHRSDRRQIDRSSAGRVDDDVLEIGHAAHVADAAHDVFGLPDLDEPSADVVVRAAHSFDDGIERHVARGHLDRIEIDLVLLDESADARNLGHAIDGLQSELQVPVLDRAELAEVVILRLQRVPEDVADAGALGAETRSDAIGQQRADVVQSLEHARACPVDVDVVIEDDVDEREAEHRLRAHGFEVRQSLKIRCERICDLIFDELRRTPRPVDVDDDLVVGDVGDRVERRAQRCPDADADEDGVQHEHDEAVFCGEANEIADHSSSSRDESQSLKVSESQRSLPIASFETLRL
jgi:hypothetical protein